MIFTKSVLVAILAAVQASADSVPLYGQCGGSNYSGATECVSSATCVSQNDYYYQCVLATATAAAAEGTTTTLSSDSNGVTSVIVKDSDEKTTADEDDETTAEATATDDDYETSAAESTDVATADEDDESTEESDATTDAAEATSTASSSSDDDDEDDESDATAAAASAVATSAAASSNSSSSSTSSSSSSGSGSGSINDTGFGYASLGDGTTGGSGGTEVEVATLDDLVKYAAADGAYIIYITADISGNEAVKVTSDKTIVGKTPGITLTGVGLSIQKESNVIIRNLVIQKCLAPIDAVGVKYGTNIWIDHVEASSDLDHDKDYYDGLFDVTHASDYVTISYCYMHDHWKTNLIGHSDDNGDEDTGHLTVTFAYNHWYNVNSRTPSLRFGTGHIYNNYYESVNDGINIRKNAVALIENNVFTDTDKPLYSVDGTGSADYTGNDFGDSSADIDSTTVSMSYSYDLIDASSVVDTITGKVGAILSF